MEPGRRHTLGQKAERYALAWLRRAGLDLVTRNFRTRHGEIDLVMHDVECLVFVEVRLRRHTAFGRAAGSIDHYKRRRLILAAATFLARHRRWQKSPIRFDVVALDASAGGDYGVDWIRDAFRPDRATDLG